MKKITICMSLLIGQAWGLSCSTPVTISEAGQNTDWHLINMNQEGQALITWNLRDSDTDKEKIVAASMNSEKKWSTATISDFAKYIVNMNTFVDASGNSFAFCEILKENDEGESSRYSQFAKQEKDQPWSPTVTVLHPEDMLKSPKQAFDSEGNILLFGIQDVKDSKSARTIGYKAVAINYLHQNSQRKETEISKTENGDLAAKLLVKNKKGNTFVLWSESSSTFNANKGYLSEKSMRGSWLQPDASWSTPEKVLTVDDGNYLSNFRGKMNDKKDMVIFGENRVGSSSLRKIQVMTCLDGHWAEPVDLVESQKHIYTFKLSMNDQGHIVAAWNGREKEKKIVWIVEKPAGQPWSSPVALSVSSKKSSLSRLNVDEEGNILVLWTTEEGKKDVVYVAEKPIGQSWISPIALTDPSEEVLEVKMSKDNQGNVLVVGRFKEGKKDVPYAIYKPAHQTWTSPVNLSDGMQDCDEFKVKTDNLGHFVVLWEEYSREGSYIHGAVLSTATGEWSSSRISPEGESCRDFSFKLSESGKGIIAWSAGDVDKRYIQVAELNLN